MSDADRSPSEDRRTEASVKHSRWPGWIWAVPVLATSIVAWLAWHYFIATGVSVTVIFGNAPNVKAHTTKVTYHGIDVGEVSEVSLTKDGDHVKVVLDLNEEIKPYLRATTRFWLRGAKPELSDPSTLKAVFAGPTIVMERGSGQPQRHFTGLEEPPAVTEPSAGTHFTVLAHKRGSLNKSSSVYHLGLKVGTITAMQFTPPDQFRFDVFVRAPYNAMVHPDTHFWDASALEFSLASGQFNASLAAPSALLTGAIAFDTPQSSAMAQRSRAGATFTLYPDEAAAEHAPSGPHASYTVAFPEAVGSLKTGAAVKLDGFTVGMVTAVEFHYDARTGSLSEPVTIEIEASRLHIVGLPSTDQVDWTGVLNTAVSRLVRKGLRARLEQAPPLVGSEFVSLAFSKGKPKSAGGLDFSHQPPAIPVSSGGGLQAVTTEIGRLPIEQIGDNVRAISAHLRSLVSSPKVEDSLTHLDRSLAEVDKVVHRAGPQIGPLVSSLRGAAAQLDDTASAARQTLGGSGQEGGIRQAVGELTRAARSVRALADYLDRHPEALIEGKSK
jgi:paraquat-inducible protein B